MAQQARPKVTGQIEERRAHCTIFSTLVVSTGMSKSDSSPTVSTPIERAFAPDVDVTGEQQRHEEQHLDEPAPAEIAQRHRPRVEEGDFDVEEQENHRHEVELHRLALARVADGGHAALVGGRLFGRRFFRAEHAGKHDRNQREPGAEGDHDEDGKPALHRQLCRLVNDFPSQSLMLTHRTAASRPAAAGTIQPMRIAWFSPFSPERSGISTYSADLIPRLTPAHAIDCFPEAAARDYVW